MRKMTMQTPIITAQEIKEPVEPKKEEAFINQRKNTFSAFVPLKDNVSKKSMDEASIFLKNSCLKPEGEVSGFAMPFANLMGDRRQSDMGLPNILQSQSKQIDSNSPLMHLKQLLGAQDGLDSKERGDSLQPRKVSNYVQIFNSMCNYKINAKEDSREKQDRKSVV